MAWCEQNRVDYVFGLARNVRLVAMIEQELAAARAMAEKSGQPARRFKDFRWSTLDSWSRRRRVIAKAEWTQGEANPRFLVTSLKRAEAGARQLYEDIYCARGDMENRIKECQLDLYADRTSAATLRANQLRLWFASMAYAKGRLIAILLTGGEAHDCPVAERLIRRVKPPKRMLGDKAYDSAELREELDERGTKPVIPNRSNRKQPYRFSKRLYKLRWRIESAFNRLKDFRRIATRYDRLARNYLASVCLVATLVWWI